MLKISVIGSLMPQMGQKKKVVAYARVSMETEMFMHALSAQVIYYNNLIQSGTGMSYRDDFNRLFTDCDAGQIDFIITKSISRFARDTVDFLTAVRKLKEKGIEIYFEKENIYALDSKGELLITIMSSLVQEESRSISENTIC